MKISTELQKFKWHAYDKGMDLRGNATRWFNGKTARAWTAWLTKARG